MELSKPKNELEVFGLSGQRDFQVVLDDKIFRILTDGLYSNKIGAVIREISCNAVDSHRAAGKPDLPIDVHLPNELEPYFQVRDYGIGLDEDGIYNLYTTLGASTKDKSNDDIGAFGLGSKSPFAYSETFTVEAIFDGTKRVFTASLAAGAPKIIPVHAEKTDEGNGLTVKIPVKKEDFHRFKTEAEKIYRYFHFYNGVPNIVNDSEFNLEIPEYSISTDFWKFRNDGRGVHVITGGVRYPVRASNIGFSNDGSTMQPKVGVRLTANDPIDEKQYIMEKFDISKEEFEQFEYVFYRLPIDIVLPIGAVEVVPSREELSYTERTIKSLFDKRLLEIVDTLVNEAKNEINLSNDIWEATHKYREIMFNSSIRDLLNPTDLTYHGRPLQHAYVTAVTTKQEVKKLTKDYVPRVYEFDVGRNTRSALGYSIGRADLKSHSILQIEDYQYGNKRRIFDHVPDSTFSFYDFDYNFSTFEESHNNEAFLIIDDVKSGRTTHVRNMIAVLSQEKNLSYKKWVMLTTDGNNIEKRKYSIMKFLKKAGLENFERTYYLSDFKKEKVKQIRVVSDRATYFTFNYGRDCQESSFIKSFEILPTKKLNRGGIYIPIDAFRTFNPIKEPEKKDDYKEWTMGWNNINSLIEVAFSLGYLKKQKRQKDWDNSKRNSKTKETIYCFNRSQMKKYDIENSETWVNLFDYLRDKVDNDQRVEFYRHSVEYDNLMSQMPQQLRIFDRDTFKALKRNNLTGFPLYKFLEVLDEHDIDTALHGKIDRINRYVKTNDEYTNLRKKNIIKATEIIDSQTIKSKITKKYPLLVHLDYPHSEDKMKEFKKQVINYIKLVETK